jgi:hypothetical protein
MAESLGAGQGTSVCCTPAIKEALDEVDASFRNSFMRVTAASYTAHYSYGRATSAVIAAIVVIVIICPGVGRCQGNISLVHPQVLEASSFPTVQSPAPARISSVKPPHVDEGDLLQEK